MQPFKIYPIDGILELKFTILKLKSSRLSYTAVEYFPFVIVICISKYDSVVGDFLSLSSSWFMSSMAESNM